MSKEQELTDQENLFLALLFAKDDHGLLRTPEEAKLLAGYDKATPIMKIVSKLKKAILERGDDYLVLFSPIGIQGLLAVLNDPTEPGAKIRLQAAAELLDRAGIVKKDKTEVTQESPNYIFMLPPKKEIDKD